MTNKSEWRAFLGMEDNGWPQFIYDDFDQCPCCEVQDPMTGKTYPEYYEEYRVFLGMTVEEF